MIRLRNTTVNKEKLARVSVYCSFAMLTYALRDILLIPVLGFLLAGAIPGTDISVPYWGMLVFYAAVIMSVFYLMSDEPLPLITKRNKSSYRLPSRRYTKF